MSLPQNPSLRTMAENHVGSTKSVMSSDRHIKHTTSHRTSILNLARRGSVNPFPLSLAELAPLSDEHDGGQTLLKMGGVESVAASIGSSVEKGICGDLEHQISIRRKFYGHNTVREPPRKTYLQLLLDAMKDTTLLILCVAAVVSLALSFVKIKSASPCDDFDPHNVDVEDEENNHTEFLESIAIIFAVVIVSNVTAMNDYSKEKQFRKLHEASRNTDVVQVVRSAKRVDINVRELVVGDIVLLTVGDKVPADGIVTSSEGFSCDESSLTGEPDLMKKPVGKYIKSGALVSEGYGQILITAVGEHTDSGKAQLLLTAETPEPTPLQAKLDVMASQIGKLGLAFAVVTFIALVIRFSVCSSSDDVNFKAKQLKVLLNYFILGITIVVVAVPEGLPLAVTISLAYSMRKMMADQNLVRKLAACETMGGATNICSDKTGTLTENRMTVTEGYIFGQFHKPIPEKSKLNNTNHVEILLEALAVNTQDSSFVQKNQSQNWEFRGNKTECALLVMCEDLGGDFSHIREDITKNQRRLRAIPFTSDRKRMTTVVLVGENINTNIESNQKYRIHTKGAAEIVLGLCGSFVKENGELAPIDEAKTKEIKENILGLARCGLRTLCIAYTEIPATHGNGDAREHVSHLNEDTLEQNLTLLAIAGIKDPVRPSVPSAVESCKKAGITVRMVTGDNIETARHIARECGILDDNGIAMEGSQFRTMDHNALLEILPRLQVLARSKPADKHTLVSKLRKLGEVVAVTGDGTNDAPALKEADVGLAMGITGTDIAKKASDIIILDDNFTSIVRAVMWGRNVNDSIRKFLQFQLTVNVSALCVAFIGAVVNSRSPLTPVQLLWVNLIMDTLAALALATELPTPDLLLRQPSGRFDSLVSPRMWLNIVCQAVLQITVLLVLLFAGETIFLHDRDGDSSTKKEDVVYTMVFNAFVFFQLFNEINCRCLDCHLNVFRGFFSNYLFPAVLITTAILQTLIVEFAGSYFKGERLTAEEFFISFGLGATALPLGAILKFVDIERYSKRFSRKTSSRLVDTTSKNTVEIEMEMQSK